MTASGIKRAYGFSFRVVEPAIALPQCDPGIDWSARRRLLARFGRVNSRSEVRLFWRPGFTGWVSRGESGYYPGELVAQWRDPHRPRMVWAHRYLDEASERKSRTRLADLLRDNAILNEICERFAARVPGMRDGGGDDAFRVFWPMLGSNRTILIGPST